MDNRHQHWIGAAVGALALTAAVSAQGPHQHSGPAHASSANDPHRSVDAVLRESDDVIASGRGFGMAFAADQNGYPGPMHAVELREQLGLTTAQVARLETLTRSMFAVSRPRSTELLDAEARLRELFADGRAAEASIEALVREIEHARADLRLVHLEAHLRSFDVLTAEQRERYSQIRWGSR